MSSLPAFTASGLGPCPLPLENGWLFSNFNYCPCLTSNSRNHTARQEKTEAPVARMPRARWGVADTEQGLRHHGAGQGLTAAGTQVTVTQKAHTSWDPVLGEAEAQSRGALPTGRPRGSSSAHPLCCEPSSASRRAGSWLSLVQGPHPPLSSPRRSLRAQLGQARWGEVAPGLGPPGPGLG